MANVSRRRRSDFRPDIEGLRAVAVLAVVMFHAGGLRGGFVGVDVFFVISGFLITRLLWSELRATGTLSLTRFYAARARRLLPAAGIVLVATTAAAAALLPPLQANSALDDGLASALYVGNYRFAVTGTDYLTAAAPSPFQHYWSLGVEEQFYLLWPTLLIGAAWLAGRRRGAAGPPVGFALVVVMAVSLALSLTWTATSPPWAFFSLPTRAWELAAGGLVAISAPLWRRFAPGWTALTGAGGLALIAWSCLTFDEKTPYPGTAALLPVAGAALIVAAGCAAPTRGIGRWLSTTWMRAVGRLSYSWYLWHWPVLVFAPLLVERQLGPAGRAVAVAASFALAVLTLRYVERPVRHAPVLRRSAGRSLALASAITAAAAGAALLLPMAVPKPVGHGVPTAAAVMHSAARLPSAGTTDALRAAIDAVQNAVAASTTQADVPADLSPPLDRAASDKPAVFLNGCVRSWRETGVPPCVSGDPAGPAVALVGDSHAAMWQPALEHAAQQRHWRLLTMTKVTCPLQGIPIVSPYLGRTYSECRQWRGEALGRLASERPKLIVVGMSRRYGPDFGFTGYDPAWLRSLTDLVTELRATTGARVLVLGPVPDPLSIVPVCLSSHLEDALACAPQRGEALNADGIAAEGRSTRAGGGQYADLSALFCTARHCPVVIGHDLVFRDDNHITISYAAALGPVIGMLADQAIAPPS